MYFCISNKRRLLVSTEKLGVYRDGVYRELVYGKKPLYKTGNTHYLKAHIDFFLETRRFE